MQTCANLLLQNTSNHILELLLLLLQPFQAVLDDLVRPNIDFVSLKL